ncbi:hypothetical protein [Propionibacterium australiense]|uniref:Uncharacterized protein n=1 Tax=Propionibacterium australiense TaxID=119981 RepID=A0A8B3FQU5_9ACTN|nr:hypothetical protein [Propionibacterium australiense]RLP11113.1 hypothetical protein D7U36_04890 [Propionibacterium australiense]RLP12440.1 hypothetical protein D9T14_00910 [Propionibacterium australiense]
MARFVLIVMVVLAINALIQVFLGSWLGIAENICWLVSAVLLGWAGSFGPERIHNGPRRACDREA